MNYPLFHTLTFDVLYACACVLIFVIIERTLYLSYLAMRSARISRDIGPRSPAATAPAMSAPKPRDPITQAVACYLDAAAHAGANVTSAASLLGITL